MTARDAARSTLRPVSSAARPRSRSPRVDRGGQRSGPARTIPLQPLPVAPGVRGLSRTVRAAGPALRLIRGMAADAFSARSTLTVGDRSSRSTASTRSSSAGTSPGCRTRSGSCSRTSSATATRTTSRRSQAGSRPRSRAARSPSPPPASCCRTSPASRPLSTSPRCETRWPTSAASRRQINPLIPVELVIDHSVQVDEFFEPARLRPQRRARVRAEPRALRVPALGPDRLRGFKVVPPGTGIVHQVNLEYLARVVEERDGAAYPDTLVGTDSHTTMVNGLGVLGWGVGGIEAEAAKLGEPLSMLVPQVVGFELTGALREGATATDLVLTVTEHAAPDGRRRQVRRVLRPRPRLAAARRPRDDREHVAGVRRDLRLLPGRRADARVPAPDRPQRRADRPRRGLLQGEHALARPERGADLLAGRQARPRDRRAVARGPAPAAGPRPALRMRRRPSSTASARSASTGRPTNGSHDKAVEDTFPASDPTTRAGAGRHRRSRSPTPCRSP